MSAKPVIFIGRTKWRDMDRPFGLRPRDRQAHMYVVGKTGTGKSSLLESLIRQDVLAGNGLALFDPHGDLAERLYAKAARIGNVHWPVRADNQTFHV